MGRTGTLVVLLSLSSGCSTQDTPRGPDAAAGEATIGGFAVRLLGEVPATQVQGKVFDGPFPSGWSWRLMEERSGCQLRKTSVPFCEPTCGSEAACVEAGSCVRYPAAQSLGKVRVAGLGAGEFEMEPIMGDYAPSADVNLPFPPCREGGTIRLQTGGGAYGVFAVEGKCIAPLELAGTGAIPIAADQPIALRWTTAQPSLTRINVTLDISHHGGKKGEISCDVPDSGALDIPASLISGLIALGASGFPTIAVTRIATSSVGILPGRVALAVSSTVERAVLVPGVMSCNDADACPAGKICQPDRTCR
jgi:hypothetical protein